MKVLITGSSGSLGKMITRHLVSRNMDVVGIDIRNGTERLPEEKFRFYRCCITDKEQLESIFSAEQPTNVVHFACSFNRIRSRQREYEIDVEGSLNVLEVSNNTPSVKQLIYSSSAAVYGAHMDNKIWLKESDLLRPGKYRYGINKKLIEKIYFNTLVRKDFNITYLRICQVVGPSDNKTGSFVSLLGKLPIIPEFCKENKAQFIHGDDFVSLMELVLEDEEINGIFNLAPKDFAVIKDLVPWKKFIWIPLSLITGLLKILWNLRILNIQPAALDTGIYPMILDPSKLILRYGYNFKFSSEEAFKSTLNINNFIR